MTHGFVRVRERARSGHELLLLRRTFDASVAGLSCRELVSIELAKLRFAEDAIDTSDGDVYELLKAYADLAGLSCDAFARLVDVSVADAHRERDEALARLSPRGAPDRSPWSHD